MTGSPFLNSIRQDLRQKGYALKTEKTYVHWIKRFTLFHQKRHPVTMADEEVRLFLSYLANNLRYLGSFLTVFQYTTHFLVLFRIAHA